MPREAKMVGNAFSITSAFGHTSVEAVCKSIKAESCFFLPKEFVSAYSISHDSEIIQSEWHWTFVIALNKTALPLSVN